MGWGEGDADGEDLRGEAVEMELRVPRGEALM